MYDTRYGRICNDIGIPSDNIALIVVMKNGQSF